MYVRIIFVTWIAHPLIDFCSRVTAFVVLNHDRATLVSLHIVHMGSGGQELIESASWQKSQIPGGKLETTDVVAVTAIMCTAAGLASIYTVSHQVAPSLPPCDLQLSRPCWNHQAVLSTIITLKMQKVETLKTIRIKYAIMGFLLLFLLGSAIA